MPPWPISCHRVLKRMRSLTCRWCLSLLLPWFFYFCFTPSRIMKVDRQLRFPFSLPLSFPFAGPHDFLAQSCYVWAPICQAVINSKKNLFLLNYFWNVKQTCLNNVAANSTLRSGLDFMLIQVEERNHETKVENAETPSSIPWENSFFNYSFHTRTGKATLWYPVWSTQWKALT